MSRARKQDFTQSRNAVEAAQKNNLSTAKIDSIQLNADIGHILVTFWYRWWYKATAETRWALVSLIALLHSLFRYLTTISKRFGSWLKDTTLNGYVFSEKHSFPCDLFADVFLTSCFRSADAAATPPPQHRRRSDEIKRDADCPPPAGNFQTKKPSFEKKSAQRSSWRPIK